MALREAVETRPERPSVPPGSGIVDGGLRAGLFAGVVMLVVGMIISAASGAGFWTPLRLAAASVLGVDALIGGFGAALLGLALHLGAAAFFGVVFAALVDRDLAADRALLAGLVYGVGVWAFMTYAGLPAFDRTMLPRVRLAPGAWFVMHLVYGACLWQTPDYKWRYGGAGAQRARTEDLERESMRL